MALLGGSGFMISLGISLLLFGLIMFFIKQKFSFYDETLKKQSDFLKHLALSVQTKLSAVGGTQSIQQQIQPPVENGQSSQDTKPVYLESNTFENNEFEKIKVSDDGSDSSESEDDSEEEKSYFSNSDDELESKSIQIVLQKIDVTNDVSNNCVVALNTMDIDKDNIESDKNDSDDLSEICDSSDDEEKTQDELSNNPVSNLEQDNIALNLSKLKVKQLTELCKQKNLPHTGKKEDLIARLNES